MTDSMPHPDQIPAALWKKMNISREAFLELREERQEREARTPEVGDIAPDFCLERLSSQGEPSGEMVRLSDHRGRPVALVFGSYT